MNHLESHELEGLHVQLFNFSKNQIETNTMFIILSEVFSIILYLKEKYRTKFCCFIFLF